MVDEVAGPVQVDVFFLTVVFKDAERLVGPDFAAREVDVFTRFASPKMMPAKRCFWLFDSSQGLLSVEFDF